MRLIASPAGFRVDFGEGLIVLGTIGVVMLSAFVALDWLQDLPLSTLKLSLLGLSTASILFGGYFVDDSARSVVALVYAVAMTSFALVVSLLIGWWENRELAISGRFEFLLWLTTAGSLVGVVALILYLRRGRQRAVT